MVKCNLNRGNLIGPRTVIKISDQNSDFESLAKDSACQNMGYLYLWIFVIFVQVADSTLERWVPEPWVCDKDEPWVCDKDEDSTFKTMKLVRRKNFDKNDHFIL